MHISEDLTWTARIQAQVNKARQRLYQLYKTVIQGFASNPENFLFWGHRKCIDLKALQRVVRLAERISGSALPSLQDIYLRHCKNRATKIIKDSNHPGNSLFTLQPSGKRFRCLMAKTERLKRSFFPQAIRLLNSAS